MTLNISDVLKKMDNVVVLTYFDKIVETFKDKRECSYIRIKILAQYLKEFNFSLENTRKTFVDNLEEKYGLLDLIIDEFKMYMAKLQHFVKVTLESGE